MAGGLLKVIGGPTFRNNGEFLAVVDKCGSEDNTLNRTPAKGAA
jgi:hypothetical protein